MDLKFDFEEQLEQLSKVPKAVRLGVVVGVLVAVAVGYYFLSYQESHSQLAVMRSQAQDLQRQLNKVRAVTQNLDEFEAEVAQLSRTLDQALLQLPNRKQFEDLLRDISTAGKKVGVQIKSIKRKPEVPHDFYAEVPFQLELEGSYHDIASFFERVARLARIVNIGSLNVEVSAEDRQQTMLRASGTATTFRFLGDGRA